MIPVLAVLLGVAVLYFVFVDRRTAYASSGRDRRTVYELSGGGFTPAVTLLLARVEGLRLLRSPLVWLVILAGAAGAPFATGEDWALRWGLTGANLFAPAAVAFVLVHFAVSRDRRSGTEELTASLPTAATSRVPGHLLSSLWLVIPVTVLWSAFVWWKLVSRGGMTVTDGTVTYQWDPPLAELAQGPVMLLVVLLLAVAAGTWWRHPVVAVIIPLLLFFSPLVWMLPLTVDAGTIAPYQVNKAVNIGYSHLVWHYLFMAGLGGLAVAAAMLRRGSRPMWGGVTLLATVALGAGFLLRRHEFFGL